MNQQSRSAQNEPNQEARRPKRKVLRQGDFEVHARGVRREDSDIHQMTTAIWNGYMNGDFDEFLEKAKRTWEAFDADRDFA